jgi:tetratricopeptide (TPR) repeat protein
VDSKEITTLSGVALGGIVGGVLVSPLGPWGAVSGSTVGATIGGWVISKVLKDFYVDLQLKMEEVKVLLEEEKYPEAVYLIGEIRDHPQYENQQRHFRSELEAALLDVTLYLARKAELENKGDLALEYYRKARRYNPSVPAVLEKIIRLKSKYESDNYIASRQMEKDLEELVELDPYAVSAYKSLLSCYDKTSAQKSVDLLLEACKVFPATDSDRIFFLEELYKRSSDDTKLPVTLGNAYLEVDDYASATALVDRVAAAGNPEVLNDPFWLAIGGTVFLHLNDLEKAEPLLKKALDEKGLLPMANFALGKLLMLKNEWAAAVSVLSPLLKIPRYYREVLVPLTTSLLKDGRLEEAQLHLEKHIFKELVEYPSVLRNLAQAYEKRSMNDKARKIWDELGGILEGPPFWQRYTLVYNDSNAVVLGGGRMGRVYLGRQRSDNKMVAIREVPLMAYSDALLMKRFRREIEVMSTLHHENVATLYGHALLEGKCLMAVEYSRLGTLKDAIGEGLLWAHVRSMITSILSGLEYLHSHNPPVVHRNLKPANILLFEDNVCKITDFALSRLLDTPVTSVVTSVDEQSSSYRYMAPEVILGSASTGTGADIYSAGVCFYELLTGRPPFDYKDVDKQIRAHLKEVPVPPSSVSKWIPPELDMIVLSMIEKVPEKRPLSCGEILAVLDRL